MVAPSKPRFGAARFPFGLHKIISFLMNFLLGGAGHISTSHANGRQRVETRPAIVKKKWLPPGLWCARGLLKLASGIFRGGRESLGQPVGLLATGLGEVGLAAAPAADDRCDGLDPVAGL